MFNLINRTVDYSVHSLLGFDIHSIALDSHFLLEPGLTLISELFTEAKPTLILSKRDIKVKNGDGGAGIEKIAQDIEAILYQHKHKVTLHPAKVHMINESLRGLISRDQHYRVNKQFVFLENPSHIFSNDIYDSIFDLQLKNEIPVLVCPEKSPYLCAKYARLNRLIDRGCMFQVDLFSLSGYYGMEAKKLSTYLIERRLVRFVSFALKDLDLIKKYNGIRISKRVARLLDEQLFIG